MISLLLPTRQRPHNLQRLANSIIDTASQPEDIEIVTYVDSDDLSYEDLELPVKWVRIGGERVDATGIVNLSHMWNLCYEASSGEIVMHAGDDICFRTLAWDETVRAAFDAVPDGILFVYGRDGIQPNTFGTHGLVTRQWVEAVGWLFLPLFSSDMNDVLLNDLAKLVGRHQFIDIYTEHLHFCANKAPIDATTQERLERHAVDRPDLLYASPEVQQMIQDAAARLRLAIQGE